MPDTSVCILLSMSPDKIVQSCRKYLISKKNNSKRHDLQYTSMGIVPHCNLIFLAQKAFSS